MGSLIGYIEAREGLGVYSYSSMVYLSVDPLLTSLLGGDGDPEFEALVPKRPVPADLSEEVRSYLSKWEEHSRFINWLTADEAMQVIIDYNDRTRQHDSSLTILRSVLQDIDADSCRIVVVLRE